MNFEHNGVSEIAFVDGAEVALTHEQKETLSSAAAHLLRCFGIKAEVDIYISKVSILHTVAGANSRAWHVSPQYDRENHILCVFVAPENSLKDMIVSLAHEMIHAWQVDRGDLVGSSWKNQDYAQLPYMAQPWEIEAHMFMKQVAGFYFEDRIPTASELEEIRLKTDQAVHELDGVVNAVELRSKIKKVAGAAGILLGGWLLGGGA